MKLRILILFVGLSLVSSSFGQSIQDLFKILPLQYTPDLTISARDSLLQFNSYTIPGGDTLSTEEVSITERQDDFLQLNYGFTTGQKAFIIIELRKFVKRNGDIVVVYAKFGGMQKAFDQHALVTFDYHGKQLVLNKGLGLPETISPTAFLKPNTTDHAKASTITLSTGYRLHSDESNSIEFFVHPETEESASWLDTEAVIYTWDGDRFKKRQ
jgi:hypothetical protein